MDESVDVKKIMEHIREKAHKQDEIQYSVLQNSLNMKNYLTQRVSKRIKSTKYQEIKQLFEKNNSKKIDAFKPNELYDNLHKANISVEINKIQPINSGRNNIVRWLALRVRHIMQNEIRFTLDPIITNQTFHNAYVVRVLNQIREYLKNNDDIRNIQKNNISEIKNYLDEQKNNISEIKNYLDEQKYQLSEILNEIKPNLTWRYLEFENRFRGAEEKIEEKQTKYLQFIEKAMNDTHAIHVLDVGCGRGEFLQVLIKNDIPAKGIDINPTMVQFNTERNRQVDLIDANSFLSSIEDNSLIGITAFQVIEHYTADYLLKFMQLTYSKIAKGGVIILETVNPLSVFSLMHFWYDLTHNKPIPPDIMKFYLEIAGFKEIDIIFSAPVPNEIILKGNDENTKKLNDILFGPQDYAVIAWKR